MTTRVSIRIERQTTPVRRAAASQESTTPDLLVQAKESTPLAAIEKALRILNGEREAILALQDSKGPTNPVDEDEEDEDEV
jgi:hypothetical protein